MKSSILLLAISVAALSSCTSAYKSGQTPDDVYYSPGRPQAEYVSSNNNDDRYYDENYYSDRYLRMKVQNHRMWSSLDDWYFDGYNSGYPYGYGGYGLGYSYNPYFYNYYPYYSFGSAWGFGPYAYLGYSYSPFGYGYYSPYYYSPIIVTNSKYTNSNTYYGPRTFNLHTYNRQAATGNATQRRININMPSGNNSSNRYYDYRNSGRDAGSFMRNIFNGNNSSPSRSFSSPSSGSSSSGGGSRSGGGSAPVRRF